MTTLPACGLDQTHPGTHRVRSAGALLLSWGQKTVPYVGDYALGLRPRPNTPGYPSGPESLRTSAFVGGGLATRPHCRKPCLARAEHSVFLVFPSVFSFFVFANGQVLGAQSSVLYSVLRRTAALDGLYRCGLSASTARGSTKRLCFSLSARRGRQGGRGQRRLEPMGCGSSAATNSG